ncbi:MAG: hypothetical protein ACYCVN_01760 [Acidimicrobiales bacterium]
MLVVTDRAVDPPVRAVEDGQSLEAAARVEARAVIGIAGPATRVVVGLAL